MVKLSLSLGVVSIGSDDNKRGLIFDIRRALRRRVYSWMDPTGLLAARAARERTCKDFIVILGIMIIKSVDGNGYESKCFGCWGSIQVKTSSRTQLKVERHFSS